MPIERTAPLPVLSIDIPQWLQLLRLAQLGGFCADDLSPTDRPRALAGRAEDPEGILVYPPAAWWQGLADALERIVPDLSPELRTDGRESSNVLELFGGPSGIQLVSALPTAFRTRDLMIRLK